MACTGRFAEAEDFAKLFCQDTPLSAEATVMIELLLDVSASDIHAAMAANDQCSCALATWAETFLAKLNCIDAAVIHNCPCTNPRLTDAQKQMWLTWLNEQLTAIRLGQLELCQGATGADYPARASAEIGLTDFSTAEIVWNAEQRALP